MAARPLRGRAVALPWPGGIDGPSSGSVAALACPAVPPPATRSSPAGARGAVAHPGPRGGRPAAPCPFSQEVERCRGALKFCFAPFYIPSISLLTNWWTSVVPGSGMRLSVQSRLILALRIATLTSCRVNWLVPILFEYRGMCRLSTASTF